MSLISNKCHSKHFEHLYFSNSLKVKRAQCLSAQRSGNSLRGDLFPMLCIVDCGWEISCLQCDAFYHEIVVSSNRNAKWRPNEIKPID